jgi:hypothetical protein
VEHAVMTGSSATVSVARPGAGDWRIVVLSRDRTDAQVYEITAAELKAEAPRQKFATFAHGASVKVELPQNVAARELLYAAFRLKPNGGGGDLLIGITSLAGEDI